MNQNSSRSVKSILLLLVFVFLKIGVAHSLSHAFSHDDLDDCEQCVFIVDSNKTNAFDGHSYFYSSNVCNVEVYSKPYNRHYKKPQFREHHHLFYFNKPPPFL